MGNISAEYTLDYIGSIETVHAISSKCARLCLNNLSVFGIINFRPQIKSEVNFRYEISILIKFFFYNIDQLW